ncbi:thymidylate synthase [Clostridia bacterium]|nr:thymidylate synthase [Clostridia bacterium]
MRVIEPSFTILNNPDGFAILQSVERIGRVCYKSEDKISKNSCRTFVSSILKRGHESVLEHEKISVLVICDRGVSHEIVRHRTASYSQESTRYCNYTNDKFGNELTFIKPFFWEEDSAAYQIWLGTMQTIEESYFRLMETGATPEEARSILPNSLKTELVMSMNLREWRHFFRLRTSAASHPQMREIARPMLLAMKELVPIVFDDIEV